MRVWGQLAAYAGIMLCAAILFFNMSFPTAVAIELEVGLAVVLCVAFLTDRKLQRRRR